MKLPDYACYATSIAIIIFMCHMLTGCASQQIVKVPIAAPCTQVKSAVKRPNPFNALSDKSSQGEVGNAVIKSMNLTY